MPTRKLGDGVDAKLGPVVTRFLSEDYEAPKLEAMTQQILTHEPFAAELSVGEKIHWPGQPDPSVISAPTDFLLVPFDKTTRASGHGTLTFDGGQGSILQRSNPWDRMTTAAPTFVDIQDAEQVCQLISKLRDARV